MPDRPNLVLNRFPVKPLGESDRTFWGYTCDFEELPEGVDIYRRLASVAYRVGVLAVAGAKPPQNPWKFRIWASVSPNTTAGKEPRPKKSNLLAKNNRPVAKVADVKRMGCAVPGETRLGCLNLFNNARRYPEAVAKCLGDVARQTGVTLETNSYRTQQDYPAEGLAQTRFWRDWAQEGIRTVLVVMPRSARKQIIRKQALQAGMATQFMVPLPKANDHKALNVVLGLLCKAGWQPVRLQPRAHWADLVVGFDTGTDRDLYYGTSAFAVLADGQSLGWELPNPTSKAVRNFPGPPSGGRSRT
ncbi:MAG: hypothetical protein SNJ60_02220 [Pseudanabaenaceae cyanobacterium]